ncbi:hypothetical protein Lser_V15G17456 [Lactuca serriola]
MAYISPNYVTLVSEVSGSAIIEGRFMDSSVVVQVCLSLHRFISYYPITQVEVVIGNNVKNPFQGFRISFGYGKVIVDERRFIRVKDTSKLTCINWMRLLTILSIYLVILLVFLAQTQQNPNYTEDVKSIDHSNVLLR